MTDDERRIAWAKAHEAVHELGVHGRTTERFDLFSQDGRAMSGRAYVNAVTNCGGVGESLTLVLEDVLDRDLDAYFEHARKLCHAIKGRC